MVPSVRSCCCCCCCCCCCIASGGALGTAPLALPCPPDGTERSAFCFEAMLAVVAAAPAVRPSVPALPPFPDCCCCCCCCCWRGCWAGARLLPSAAPPCCLPCPAAGGERERDLPTCAWCRPLERERDRCLRSLERLTERECERRLASGGDRGDRERLRRTGDDARERLGRCGGLRERPRRNTGDLERLCLGNGEREGPRRSTGERPRAGERDRNSERERPRRNCGCCCWELLRLPRTRARGEGLARVALAALPWLPLLLLSAGCASYRLASALLRAAAAAPVIAVLPASCALCRLCAGLLSPAGPPAVRLLLLVGTSRAAGGAVSKRALAVAAADVAPKLLALAAAQRSSN